MCRDIGRIIVKWAYIEQYMQGLVYMAAKVSPEIGRLAVREPRLNERLDLILDLLHLRKLNTPPIDYKVFREILSDLEDMRNVVAHSAWVWSDNPKGWAAHVARGNWEGIPRTDRSNRSKRTRPEGQLIKDGILKTYIDGADWLIAQLKEFQANLEVQIASSQRTRPAQ